MLSRALRYSFVLILALMLGLAVYNAITYQTLDDQINATVTARIRLTEMPLTETAVHVTPDLEATVEARIRGTLSPVPPTSTATATPTPSADTGGNDTGFLGAIGIIISSIFGFLRSLWELFGRGGWLLQLCCCGIIPGFIIYAMISESR